MGSNFSYSSANNSRSSETLKGITGTSHDDVFVSSSINSYMSPDNNRMSMHYLPQVTQALPDETSEYRQLLATAIKDAKEQHVMDFLR